MQPDYTKLYRVKDPLATQPIRLEPYDDEWLDQRMAVGLLRGELYKQLPLKVRPAMGGRFVDLMWSTFSPIKVISQRLADLLNTHGFTGWNTYKVEVLDKEGQIRPDYHGLAITGKAGSHDLRRVQEIEKSAIFPGGKQYIDLKGLYFENDEWDGNDLCLMGSSIICVVTERVVQAFKKANIRNIQFTLLTEVEIPASVYEIQGLWPIKD